MKLPNNWRSITITSCLYRLFMAMNATFIQVKMHKQDKLSIFSNSQRGFVAGVPGCMKHAFMTRELSAHAIHSRSDLHMIQNDFTNAFGSVPHGLIAHNMACMGLPSDQIEIVMNIYKDATTRISVPTGVSEPINWRSGTVQVCPPFPTLFNLCLEPFLRLFEKSEFEQYGFTVKDEAGNVVASTNVAAYADGLILYSETRDDAQLMLNALADFCNYSGMEVNTRKRVSVSVTWNGGVQEDFYAPFEKRTGRCPMDARGMPIPEECNRSCKLEEIPVQEASVYLGLPIGFNKENCSIHGSEVLESMTVNITKLGKSNLNITQKLEGIKSMELARIDYRMMCADITEADLDKFDRWLRGTVQSWLKMNGIPMGLPGMPWRDRGLTLPSLRERQDTMIIRTICDIMTSKDPEIGKIMDDFEQEQAEKWHMGIAKRENDHDKKGFLRWAGKNPDWRKEPVAKLQSIFPRAFKAVQKSDISVFIRDGVAHLSHDTAAEDFTVSNFSRPAMWITHCVMRRNHWDAFGTKVMASKRWHELEDNPASNHFLNWATSKYDDAILKFAIGIRLNTLKTPATLKTDRAEDIQCCWCSKKNVDMAHIMTNCRERNGRDAVKSAIQEGIEGVHIQDDVRVARICASITDEEGALKRPDLMYESLFHKKNETLKIYDLTEITSLWAWDIHLTEHMRRDHAFCSQKNMKETPLHAAKHMDPSVT
jgi:hypothetical protein